MDFKNINKLAELMQNYDLTAAEVTEDGSTIKLERKPVAAVPVQAAAPAAPVAGVTVSAPTEDVGVYTVKSPTVGVFYSSSSPDAKPFVEVGSVVKQGDVLCIIEAMKLMNEIAAEEGGTIQEICIGNGQVVEYGQPLFKIRK